MATSRLERIGTIFTRKQVDEKLLNNLLELITCLDADYNALKKNEEKLQQITGSFLKCMHQSAAAIKEKLKTSKEIYATFKKAFDELHMEHKGEMDKLGADLEQDIRKLKEKLILETKRSEREHLQQYFIRAMQNNN